MVGAGAPTTIQAMRVGPIYQPYYLVVLIVAACVVWGGRQAWDITRTISVPKAVAAVGLLWLSLLMLFTQSYNPFIYYIF
jgi:alginate O-acetyltransferase complex protein AlgI